MQKYVVLNKKDFNDFIIRLSKTEKVVAPVVKGQKSFAFKEVTSGEEIAINYIPTILPPKKYFMPQTEKLLEYNISEKNNIPVLEYEKLVVFGVHTCDLAGIQCLDMVFSDEPKDINYLERKNKIAIIGLECNKYCDEFASCSVMDNHMPNGGYDLFFTELEDSFIVHVSTVLGEKIIENTKVFQDPKPSDLDRLNVIRKKKRDIFKDEIKTTHKNLKQLFDSSYDSPVWNDLEKRCVSCGNCTNVCPTCYCFDIRDEINLDLNTGIKSRVWDSCQNEEFAKVAGGENFREERSSQQRHRYMRKFKYPVDKYSRYFCTGCGRCSRTCMANINLKETLDSLAEGSE